MLVLVLVVLDVVGIVCQNTISLTSLSRADMRDARGCHMILPSCTKRELSILLQSSPNIRSFYTHILTVLVFQSIYKCRWIMTKVIETNSTWNSEERWGADMPWRSVSYEQRIKGI
jgi:hypothetical protein